MAATLFTWWSALVAGFGIKFVLAQLNLAHLATDLSIAAITAALMTLTTWLAGVVADMLSFGRVASSLLHIVLLVPVGFVAFVLLSHLFFFLNFNNHEGTLSITAGAAATAATKWLLSARDRSE